MTKYPKIDPDQACGFVCFHSERKCFLFPDVPWWESPEANGSSMTRCRGLLQSAQHHVSAKLIHPSRTLSESLSLSLSVSLSLWCVPKPTLSVFRSQLFSSQYLSCVAIRDCNVGWHGPKPLTLDGVRQPPHEPIEQLMGRRAQIKVLNHCLHYLWMGLGQSKLSRNFTDFPHNILP